ncbi:MAG: hypothetical protein SGARI_001060, partial [Bacillariaceae sp.]
MSETSATKEPTADLEAALQTPSTSMEEQKEPAKDQAAVEEVQSNIDAEKDMPATKMDTEKPPITSAEQA